MSSKMKLEIYRVLNLDQFLPKSSNRFADSNITARLHLGILFQIYGQNWPGLRGNNLIQIF
jgi:hypothetical protein